MFKPITKFLSVVALLVPLTVFSVEPNGFILTDNGVPVKLFNTSKKESFGTVILLHGCNGVGPHEEIVAERFTDRGFDAVVIDSWKYRKITSVCQTNAVEGYQRLEEVYKAVNWIKQQPWHKEKIFLIGYSHGASTALAASRNGPEKGIDKAVAFYPYCFPQDHAEPKIPVQLHIGEKDDWTPAYRCRGIYNGLFKKYTYGEYYEYPDTYHAFDHTVDKVIPGIGQGGVVTPRIIRWNINSTYEAYKRTLKFFKEIN
jgi:dienelactone hydrolase